MKNAKVLVIDDEPSITSSIKYGLEKEGYTVTKHQREVGTSYFDAISNAISSGESSTTAMKDSTETDQF